MGVPILVLGESGTGKSTSLRNFKKDDIAIVNVAGKPLPFKGSFNSISGVEYRNIARFMKDTKAKSIVVDDAQYIMSFQYMRRIKENGWDKFNELQSDFFNLIDLVKDLPDDVVVYFLSHLETKEDGRQKIKTIGKMLDEKITIEGMFTVVLKTYTADGKYYFLTQNSGNDTTKSPMGMFPSYAIDNDLKYVDDKVRNYYELGDYLTDEEMAEIDKAVAKVDVIKDEVEGKKRRSARGKKYGDAESDTGETDKGTATESAKANARDSESEPSDINTAKDTTTAEVRRRSRSEAVRSRDNASENDSESADAGSETAEKTPRRKRRSENDNASNVDQSADHGDSKVDAGGNDEKSTDENQNNGGTNRRRRRSVGESIAEERKAVRQENAENLVNAGMKEAGDAEEVPYENVKEPELKEMPRRKRRSADAEADKSASEDNAEGSQSGAHVHEQYDGAMNPPAEEAPRRRRRR